MLKLPKLTLEFIYAKNLTKEESDSFNLWIKTFKGEHQYIAINNEILIEYNVYESFCRYEQDMKLLQSLKQLINKDNGIS